LRFEVRYPQGGQSHEVTLQGTVAVIGRDPACELLVSDPKCSRRHAVLEAGPQGITIRDAGSANGVFVNDRKVERAPIKEGDLVRLGDVVLRVLPEDLPGTLMMGPEDMDAVADGQPPPPAPRADAPSPSGPSPAPAPPAPSAAAAASSVPAGPSARRPEASVQPEKPAARPAPSGAARPTAVMVLSVLWLLSVPLYGLGGLAVADGLGWSGLRAAAPVGLGLMLALLSGVMGYGLWTLAPWARAAQIVLAAIGLFFCPFTLASAAVLVYMARPTARAAFNRPRVGARSPEAPPPDAALEGVFTAVILGTVLLGVAASGAALALSRRGGGSMEQALTSAREETAVARLRSLAGAQAQFKSGTCVDAYADLEALLKPGSAIPGYPPDGPAFVPPEFARAEAKGYHFTLTVEDPVPATEGCAVRGYRRFTYAAQPLEADGRHLVVGADGVVHAALGRPATLDDPAVR
jgi:FHA domain-containing protein